MSKQEQGCVIYPKSGEVEFEGVTITLRPKTFDLLLLLASKPGEVISKAQILQAIWSESIVEDQVVFQSINEIRKELGASDIIKTYPRRGYAWTFDNTQIKNQEGAETKTNSTNRFAAKKLSYLLACIVLFAFIALFFTQSKYSEQDTFSPDTETVSASHQGILILPFSVDALQEPEKWLRFGALQNLIDKIPAADKVTVFQLEDTLEILSRFSSQEKRDVSKIFKKSGATVILQTSISGVPGDYHFLYSKFTQNTVDTKSFNVKTINEGVSALARLFEQAIEPAKSIDSAFIDKQLQDNLIAKAIQFLEVNDYESALAFLNSASVADKTNIYVHYLIAKVASQLGHYEQALAATQTALKLSNNDDSEQYQNRLLYLHGTLLLIQRKVDLAEKVLIEAEALSKQNKDWLYYSYTHSILGKVHEVKGQYAKAKAYYNSALEYQELLQCPMGIAQSHLNLAEFYFTQQQTDVALKSMKIAETLIKEQKLQQAEPILAYIKAKLELGKVTPQ